MKFNIVPRVGVWWPVIVRMAGDGGTIIEGEFDVRFLRLPSAELKDLGELTNDAWLTKVADDWRDVGVDGVPKAFSDPAQRAEVLSWPGVMDALVRGWTAFVNAEPERRLGNSAASPGTAPAGAEAAQPAAPSPSS